MSGEIVLILIDLKCSKDESDEDGGGKTPKESFTKEHDNALLESEESGVISRTGSIGMVRGGVIIKVLV